VTTETSKQVYDEDVAKGLVLARKEKLRAALEDLEMMRECEPTFQLEFDVGLPTALELRAHELVSAIDDWWKLRPELFPERTEGDRVP